MMEFNRLLSLVVQTVLSGRCSTQIVVEMRERLERGQEEEVERTSV